MPTIEDRARLHAALGVPARMAVIDAIAVSDHTVTELRRMTGLPGNLLAHHLDVLENVGLVERRRSEGDHRRRYVVLRPAEELPPPPPISRQPLFVCTHNSARSQFAAALWHDRTGRRVQSAGTEPAARVHPQAIAAAADFGVDLSESAPRGYDAIGAASELVISVCDRAGEAAPPPGGAPRIHWSIPDPVLAGGDRAFRDAFSEISERIDRLVTVR